MFVVNKKIKARKLSKPAKDDNIKTGYTNSSLESLVDIEPCVENNIPVVEFDKQKVGDWVLAFYEFDQMHFLGKILQVSSEFKKAKVVCFFLSNHMVQMMYENLKANNRLCGMIVHSYLYHPWYLS